MPKNSRGGCIKAENDFDNEAYVSQALILSPKAFGSIDLKDRLMALQCGVNVLIPNLSPLNVMELYKIYDNKTYVNAEVADGLSLL